MFTKMYYGTDEIETGIPTAGARIIFALAFGIRHRSDPGQANDANGRKLVRPPDKPGSRVAILTPIAMFAGGIIVDQYPCRSGVPNCDQKGFRIKYLF